METLDATGPADQITDCAVCDDLLEREVEVDTSRIASAEGEDK